LAVFFSSHRRAAARFEMTVADDTITVHDNSAGEVWIGSGQSNMGFPMARCDGCRERDRGASYPLIRLLR